MLHDVIEQGTGDQAKLPVWAAGKTGTTQSYRDAWFVGWAGDVSTAVWVGNRDSAGADDERARHRGHRRQLPCQHLARVHDRCDEGPERSGHRRRRPRPPAQVRCARLRGFEAAGQQALPADGRDVPASRRSSRRRPASCTDPRNPRQKATPTWTTTGGSRSIRDADPEVIERAYKALSMKHHPDRAASDNRAAATRRMQAHQRGVPRAAGSGGPAALRRDAAASEARADGTSSGSADSSGCSTDRLHAETPPLEVPRGA